MATLEQVEKLREKANVSYNDAKAALEACGDDLLDAVIYLESQGKIKQPQNGGYYSSIGTVGHNKQQDNTGPGYNDNLGKSFSRLFRRSLRWCGIIITKGNRNSFEVRQHERVVMAIPVTVLALFLLSAFWIVVPLMLIGFFFNFRYVFKGAELERTGVNHVMNSAADAADNLKKEVVKDRG